MDSAAAAEEAATSHHSPNRSVANCIESSSQHSSNSITTGRSLAHQQQEPFAMTHDNSPNSNSSCSPNSNSNIVSSSSSSSTTSSPPQYSEDLRRTTMPALDLLPRQGSASSTKTCEVDLGDEERDTFSPISSSTNSSPSDMAAVVPTGGSDGMCNGDGASSSVAVIDNKVYDGSSSSTLPSLKLTSKISNGALTGNAALHSTSKEEKQRQNEEIVIMETSSISSETGSWESVFPHPVTAATVVGITTVTMSTVSQILPAPQAPVTSGSTNIRDSDLRISCTEFLQHERKVQQLRVEKPKEKDKTALGNLKGDSSLNLLNEPEIKPYLRERTYSSGAAITADTSSLFATGGSATCLLRELENRENALSTSGTSACFIDASSLRDEDEVLSFPSLDGQQSNDDRETNEAENDIDNFVKNVREDDESPTKKLSTFHKTFAKCKLKSKDFPETSFSTTSLQSKSSSSSNSGADSPQKPNSGASASSTNNLSDEEKLWKREHDTQKIPLNIEVKNEYDKDAHGQEDATEGSVSLAADVDSSDSSEVVKMRREQELKSVPYTFQHSMQQYSIDPLGVSPKFTTHNVAPPSSATLPNAANAVHSDLSYTTDYSSSSPAPSLVWSEHEHRPCGSGRHHAEEYDGHSILKPCMLPETPHNSIVHIDNASSNTSSIHRDCTLSSSLSHQRDSGAYCSDATDSPVPMPRTPKRSKFDEANPIVSGGASIKDFSIKQCESPPIKRRTDTCPVVSGGFVSLDFERVRPLGEDDEEKVELRAKPKIRKPISGIASWVVDMSDCRPERRKSTSSTSSMEAGASGKFRERSDSMSSNKSGCGFYVSLDDMDKKPADDLNTKQIKPQAMSKSCTASKTGGFFVNLSKSDCKPKESEMLETQQKGPSDKKNIFSMFIDIGDKKAGMNGKREPFNLAQRLSSSFTSSQRRSEDVMKSSASSTETLMAKSSNLKNIYDNDIGESKSLDYRCNLEAPITVAAIRRISQQQRAQNEAATKRHSWGNGQVKDGVSHDYKRSISLTANGESKENGNGLMSIIDKLPIISKTSSLSVDSSLSPYDEYTGSKSELSSCSNNSARNSMSGGDDELLNPANGTTRTKKRRRDVQINETFDKSSLASITDGMLSKDLSPASATDTDDLTFQQDEELAFREVALIQQQPQQQTQPQQPLSQIPSNRSSAIIMETIIEAKETSSPKKNSAGHTMETLHATIEKQKMLLETVNEHTDATEKSSFVKLSDMDKPVKFELHSPESMSKSVGNHRQINRLFRDESKTRPHSWSMTRSTGNSFLNITNSVENMRSLSRLFPNLTKEFSNSLPNDMDYIQTDVSAESSLASSFSRSGMDESSISCRQPRRLGEDLLKMFLQEIATDMIVEVQGRRIKAHKCILRSRCEYFAAMLAGKGSQSVVKLEGYSFSAVHFALCHVYSGASHPPDGISLMELAALADLLGLEGLREVTAHALKTNYCHNFHKPCSGCIDGILQVLPVALNHALDDLYFKCLRWTCRHYLKVWPTRQFAQLPPDILGSCRQQIVAYLNSETVLEAILEGDNLLTQLASHRWAVVCVNLVRDILDVAYSYIAEHFASLIASDAFLSLGHDCSCHIPRLERVLLRTASSLTPVQACRSYQRVMRLNTVLQAKVIQMPANLGDLAKELQGLQEEDLDWDPEFIRLVSAILSAVEQCLIQQCSRAMRVTAWQRMDLDLRKKIQTLAHLTEPIDLKRGKPVSKAFTFSGSTRNQDLYQVKLAIQAHSKNALAQDTQLYKSTQTHEAGNVQTSERGVQANNDLREGTSKILKSNSRAHVPQTFRAAGASNTTVVNTQSTIVSERNSMNTHRRTQSEAPISSIKFTTQKQKPPTETKTIEPTKTRVPPRLVDVRPRYLEPRKVHAVGTGPVRSATSSSIPATKNKGRLISSSESSRNSSPATRKTAAVNVAAKISTKSINMSLDSLASPTRRTKSVTRGGKSSDTERISDACVDSLADSMKSSMITNKTVSQESLARDAKLSRSNALISNNKLSINRQISSQGSKVNCISGISNPRASRGATIGTKAPKHLQQHLPTKSTGSSPSSVTTTKSAASRLSSVSSTHSSRDLHKHRSISMPGQQQQQLQTNTAAGLSANSDRGGVRHSFLSAKSREILAKRAEKNKLLQQQQLQQLNGSSSGDEKPASNRITAPLRSASHKAVTAATYNNRKALPSNIPRRRPNTLQLKETTLTSKCSIVCRIIKTPPPNMVTRKILILSKADSWSNGGESSKLLSSSEVIESQQRSLLMWYKETIKKKKKKRSDKDGSNKKGSEKESSDKEGSDKKGSDRESSEKKGSTKESSDKDVSVLQIIE